jgi:hypothetical protein
MGPRFANGPPVPPLAGYLLKAVFSFSLLRFDLSLFSFTLCFPFRHWINARRQGLPGGKVMVSGLGKAHNWILPQRHQFLFLIEPIAPAPEFGPARIDKEKQSIAVVNLVRAFTRSNCPSGDIRERHFSSSNS